MITCGLLVRIVTRSGPGGALVAEGVGELAAEPGVLVGRGFASAANRAYLSRGGGHYIHAEKLRNTNAEAAAALARQGRYHEVAGNLRVKEVWVPAKDAGERAERFAVCHNPEQAERDRLVRERLIAHLEQLIDGSDAWAPGKRDELIGSLKDKPALRRLVRRTKTGLLRTNDHTLTQPTRPRRTGARGSLERRTP